MNSNLFHTRYDMRVFGLNIKLLYAGFADFLNRVNI